VNGSYRIVRGIAISIERIACRRSGADMFPEVEILFGNRTGLVIR
jgi:hypothetical protein